MKTIAVIGAKGMLGLAVSEYFSRRGDRVIPLTRNEYDIAGDPLERLEDLLSDARHVVNCAGVIKPLIAQTAAEDVLKVNAIFPRNLARLCDRRGAQLFHVTTDCVYSGRDGGYDENAFFDAEDVYGLSKNAGDAADCMVLRTSIIGEERGQQRSLLEWARSQAGKEVNGFLNHRWNGVTTLHLAELIDRIIEDGLYEKGIFHVHSPETVTKHELVSMLSEVYGLGLTIHPVDAAEACDRSLASARPLCRRLEVKPLRQQLAELRDFFSA